MKNGFQKLTAIFMTVLMFLAVIPVSAWGAERYSNSVVPGISVLSILPGDTNTITYIFQKKNGEQTEEIARQIVKKGDTLLEPEVKTGENEKFTGWDPAVTFGTVGEITETKTITVTAKIEKVYYIFFKDNTGRVVATKECTDGQTVSDFSDVTFPVGPDESITGWYFDAANTQKANSVTISGQNVTLYAKVEKGYWITFDANGGSYTAPVFYANGTAAAEPATTPTLPGYSFDRWYLDKECKNEADFSKITTSTTVYAGWEAANTTYTVIHWQENADDNGYSYKESETKQGASGKQTAATAKSYLGCTAQAIEQKTIAGDGSTIVNVYYKRNVYDIKFYEEKWSGPFGSDWSEITSKRITAKYGANIRDKWPGGTWKVSKNGSVAQSNIDVMPLGGANFYEKKQGNGKAYYYLEDLNGNYVLDHTDTGANSSGVTVTKEDRYDITGFTCDIDRSPKDGSNYNGAKFYYTRNSYNVVYVSNGQIVNTASYKYEADISGAGNAYKPTIPPAGKEDYVFAGWYADPTGQTEYKFDGKTMPAQNITVYAKWVPPTYTVTLYDHDGKMIALGTDSEGNPIYSLTVAKGAKFDESQVPTITLDEGETFLGWTLKDGTPFNLDTEINRDYELHARVGSQKGYSVKYDGNGATSGDAPIDDTKYAEGSYADVKLPGDLAMKDKVFLGWATEATDPTKIYQPGDKLPIEAGKAVDGVITLYAVWGDKPVQTNLTYKANFEGAEPAEKVCELENNATVTILDYGDDKLGLPLRSGYEFLGWSENPKATETDKLYKAGDQIIVDETDAAAKNILYAIWKQSTVKLTVTKTVTGNFGDKSKAFQFSMQVDGGNSFKLTANGTALANGSQSDYIFSLKHGENIVIEGMPVGKKIVLAETNAEQYTVSFNDTVETNRNYVNEKGLTADTEIKVENDRNTPPDTGVFVDSLPYILIIACVAGVAALFLIRRRKKRED
ncbi:MAG: InlB B-repeat-containing protein [Lachnospiraceae bacterium]